MVDLKEKESADDSAYITYNIEKALDNAEAVSKHVQALCAIILSFERKVTALEAKIADLEKNR